MANKHIETRRGDCFPFFTVVTILGVYMSCVFGCATPAEEGNANPNRSDAAVTATGKPQAGPKSGESKVTDSAVAAEIEKLEAEKRATLLKDAQSAMDETRNALTALDRRDMQAALTALERVTGKLDLLVARDPKMAVAPVGVTTVIPDLYGAPATVKAVVAQAATFSRASESRMRATWLRILPVRPIFTSPGFLWALTRRQLRL